MKAYKINLERKPEFNDVTILEKHENNYFRLCKFKIMNGIFYIMSTTSNYINLEALTEEDFVLLSLEKEIITLLRKAVIESLKWLEHWTSESSEFMSSELYL